MVKTNIEHLIDSIKDAITPDEKEEVLCLEDLEERITAHRVAASQVGRFEREYFEKAFGALLKMRKLCGILKHAGTHIEMAIHWESYISAATSKLSRLAFAEANIELRTTHVSGARMQAAALLEHLKFDLTSPIIIGDRGYWFLCARITSATLFYIDGIAATP